MMLDRSGEHVLTGGRDGLKKLSPYPGRLVADGVLVRASWRRAELHFSAIKKKDVEPGRLLSTQSSQLPADAQPIATRDTRPDLSFFARS